MLTATSQFVRGDGSHGQVGDVFLSFDREDADLNADAGPTNPGTPITQDEDNTVRTADGRPGRVVHTQPARRDPLDWIEANHLPSTAIDRQLAEMDKDLWQSRFGFSGLVNGRARGQVNAKEPRDAFLSATSDDDVLAGAANGLGTTNTGVSALHQGLGVSDKRMLHMIDAMASFGADQDSGMMSTTMHDPKVAKLLTALPQMHQA